MIDGKALELTDLFVEVYKNLLAKNVDTIAAKDAAIKIIERVDIDSGQSKRWDNYQRR